MINRALFLKEWKGNYKLLIIFGLVLTMYTSMIISMFDPKLGSALEEFSKTMPEVMAMFGMADAGTTLILFISNYLYGMLLIAFPMIMIIILSLRLVARHVDRGSMAYLLTNKASRHTFIFTQTSVLVTSVIALLAYCTLIGLLCSQFMFPGELEVDAYLRLNVGLLCLHLFIAGFCFLCSCIFNEYKYAAMAGAGVPILFLLIQMLANMGGDLEKMRYATMFTFFSSAELVEGSDEGYLFCGILLLAGIVCFVAGEIVFRKKDLHV